jgi:hypothetical protein
VRLCRACPAVLWEFIFRWLGSEIFLFPKCMYHKQHVRVRPCCAIATATVDHREGLLCRSRATSRQTLRCCSPVLPVICRVPVRIFQYRLFGRLRTCWVPRPKLVMLASYLLSPIVRASETSTSGTRTLTGASEDTTARACQAGAARRRPHIIFDRRASDLLTRKSITKVVCCVALHVQSTPMNFRVRQLFKGPFTA